MKTQWHLACVTAGQAKARVGSDLNTHEELGEAVKVAGEQKETLCAYPGTPQK